MNWKYSSMSPVNAGEANDLGFFDVWGNAWEWTLDYFSPLPGFQVHRYYEDFSTPCFDGLHNVIQSSSFISTGNLASVFSRYHFRPHFTQHSSFRVVEPLGDALTTSDTDAPGPFVGKYPFRRSSSAVEAMQIEEARISEEARFNSNLSKHFLAVPKQFVLRDAGVFGRNGVVDVLTRLLGAQQLSQSTAIG